MKNFIPRHKQTRKDRTRLYHPENNNNFSACALSLTDDLNVHLIYRTLSNFAGKEFFIVGSKKWFKGATNGISVPITYFDTVNQFLERIKQTDYNIISIEQTENSKNITDFNYPEKPCFIFGNESFGLGDDVILNSDHVIEIPMENYFHPCLNVGVCAGIVMYDYVNKL